MKKTCLHILFSSFTLICWGQNLDQSEKYWINQVEKLHSSYKCDFDLLNDSMLQTGKRFNYKFSPSVLAAYDSKTIKTNAGIQFLVSKKFSEKLNLKLYNELGFTNAPLITYQSVLRNKAFFYFPIQDQQAIFNDLRTRLTFTPNKMIQLETGMDKHFLGEGSRSLLLGNQGISSPFIMMKTKIWKLEYISLHQVWRENNPGHYLPKANSSHYLNFNHKNKISFGVFESVVHIIKDTLYNRGFEVEYLNPLIFYRPQEYSIGSPDNVVLGLNGFITWKKNQLYGQFALDDFNVHELKKRLGWWANKYGIQAGFKTWLNVFNKAIFFRTEINIVTPFTYSAQSNNLNYSNQGLPVAHPLGGNFIEWYNESSFDFKGFNLHTWAQFYKKGNDPLNSSDSYGGDIYKSYNNRPAALGDYGYYLGIGEPTYVFQLGSKISRMITKYKWTIFAEPRLYLTKRSPKIVPDVFFTVGIHTNFLADKRNY